MPEERYGYEEIANKPIDHESLSELFTKQNSPTEDLKQKATEWVADYVRQPVEVVRKADLRFYENLQTAYIAGATENGLQWHKIFIGKEPNPCEYWELPQETLPKNENFYFVRLKNGYVKICELKYDPWSRKKYFHDLHGGRQSNVAEWLDYPETFHLNILEPIRRSSKCQKT